MDKKKLAVPQSDIKDVGHIGITTFLSSIPGLAGLGELFKFIMTPSLEKRRDEWMQNAADVLIELDARDGINIEDLQKNDEFVTLLLQLTQVAQRTHQEEKRRALKNALAGSIIASEEFDVKSVYISILDRLSVTQIHILKLIAGREIHRNTIIRRRDQYFGALSRKISPRVMLPVLEALVNELIQVGLIEEFDHRESGFHYYLSAFGTGFFDFIDGPDGA